MSLIDYGGNHGKSLYCLWTNKDKCINLNSITTIPTNIMIYSSIENINLKFAVQGSNQNKKF